MTAYPPNYDLASCGCIVGYTYTAGLCQIVCDAGCERTDAHTCACPQTCEE